ncbi:phosphatase PAP2 family protein [Chitinilyticum piscinae]|uniref:Phosphatase PAP2 family protein n=1 Tax=Chitinilyticum piscinae TaxID=2866724 RepID=A0A8J7FK98_9NEIS|nr:phosphatase PAP2 family protein [Chitinilyticum piscinae]MBE9608189.1 phosphatase PAP2 family protein [Chitinilyticum piscinae]
MRLFLSFTLLLAFVVLLLAFPALASLDTSVGSWWYARNDWLVSLSQQIGLIGSGPVTLLLAMVLACWFARTRQDYFAALLIPAGLLGSWGLNYLAKSLIARPRPHWEHLMQVDSSSFPSGHAMAALTLAVLLANVLIRHYPRQQLLWLTLATIWVLLSGMARLVLGVHYLTDILAAYLLAGVWCCLLVRWYSGRTTPSGCCTQS